MIKISRKYFLYIITIIFLTVGISSCKQHKINVTSSIILKDNWQLFSDDSCSSDGDAISTNEFNFLNFHETSIPSTVFNALVKDGSYNGIYYGTNLKKINSDKFNSPWWYRTSFDISSIDNNYELKFEGINYKANIWLNGKMLADTSEVNNAFRIYNFDISKYVVKGRNILALKVFPPVAGDFSIGFVDWNPAPPDNNMGIFRPVILNIINKVKISQTYVESYFLNSDYSTAYENVSFTVKNYSSSDMSGEVSVEINGKIIKQIVELKAGEKKQIVFEAAKYKELVVNDAKLWWPHTIGEPIMNNAKFVFKSKNVILAKEYLSYGVREIKDYFTEEGHRGFMINGQKISIRGAGWVDNMILDNTHDYDRAQLEYVKNMNLNTIRLEGFWGEDDYLYKTCDKLGILVMVGWSCHWEWEDYLGKVCDEKYGGIINDYDVKMMSKAWENQLVWLRNHPSIFAWFGGSDCIATPKLENNYFKTFDTYDSSRIYLSSAKEWETPEIKSGVKMRGPYAYEPPVYWFSDTLYGGAFGFNTETGPGAQVPPIESLKKMIPEKDLWPINKVWDFHCARNEFKNLDRYTYALNQRYGKANSVEEYAQKAQMLNYELMRPMFEAFSVNRYKATGVIQWMLNSAWPEMYWQLYDYYLMPNGAFYATKKAGEPLQAIYNYGDKSIYLVNDKLQDENEVSIVVNVLDINSKVLFTKQIKTDAKANSSINILSIPEFKDISSTYFIDLRINKDNKELENNFYWLSTKKDVLDYDFKFENWYYHTPSKQYADYSALNSMKKTKVNYKISSVKESNSIIYKIELENESANLAFFMELQLIDARTSEVILPVIFSDNYISLLPDEKRIISAKVDNKYLLNKKVELRVKGINLKELTK